MGLVVAIFIITAAYVGYYASQSQPEGETHSIPAYTQTVIVHSDVAKIKPFTEIGISA
ncbi:MAG: hypothetical protein KC483_08805 [Nitrosarchaeum sp.]|nr:hypothetical protein [Nitrosarchaeum sp.]